jgi:N-acetyl-gamma-glutamyl-phosphate reductase
MGGAASGSQVGKVMAQRKIRIGVIGASGYTGADLMRLAVTHGGMEIVALTANTHAGKSVAEVFPHLAFVDLPKMTTWETADWSKVDAVFSGLPHGTTQDIAKKILADHPQAKFIDMSADFRLTDPATYRTWYGHDHLALDLQKEAVYGLTEHNRDAIVKARVIACPGCYPTAALLALLPPVKEGAIDASDLVIDAKSGISGAGRTLKQSSLFSESGEGLSPYSVANHRHAPEIEQELSKAAGRSLIVNFTPHLIPMSRGELITAYVRLSRGMTPDALRALLVDAYRDEPFVKIAPAGVLPATQNVRGSNYVQIGVVADRIAGRAIVISVIDNLVKGSAGQAIQNFNLAYGFPETTGLMQQPLFP